MKRLLRLFCVLLCFVLLFSAFSVIVNAEIIDSPLYNIIIQQSTTFESNRQSENVGFTVNRYDDYKDRFNSVTSISDFKGGLISTVSVYSIIPQNFGILIPKSDKVTLSFNQVWCGFFGSIDGSNYWSRGANSCSLRIFYEDGEVILIQNVPFTIKNNLCNFSVTFSATQNIEKIDFIVTNNLTINKTGALDFNYRIGEYENARFLFVVDCETKELSFLETIFSRLDVNFHGVLWGMHSFLSSIRDTVSNLSSSIWSQFSSSFTTLINDFNSFYDFISSRLDFNFSGVLWSIQRFVSSLADDVKNLPSTIFDGIEGIFEKLFVPNEENYIEMFEKFKKFMLDKFGGLYQIGELFYQRWQELYIEKQVDTFTIPELNLKLPENVTLNLGPYTFKIVPNGFEFLANILKNIIGIICTLFFVNGLKYRYNRLMGVKE